jgi:16S rRNA (cytosine1402-N4)-methyltransferase
MQGREEHRPKGENDDRRPKDADLRSEGRGRHVPVLLQRCLDLLAPALAPAGAVVVDCTLGLGGHSEALLSTFPAVRLIGLDRDKEALRLAGERLAPYGERATLVHGPVPRHRRRRGAEHLSRR